MRNFARSLALIVTFLVAPALARANPHIIAVFGDSLADGVWSGLHEEVKANPGDAAIRDSKVGTGMTRPDYNEFFTHFAGTLAPGKVTDIIVIFGANDEEGLRDDNHKGYAFQSPGWTNVYLGRVRAIIAAGHAQGAKIFWLGLPILRDPDRNTGARYINSILQPEVARDGAVFISLEDDFKGPDGGFATHLADPAGHMREVRGPDGIHFTFYGYDLIAKKVYAAIRAPAPLTASATKPQ